MMHLHYARDFFLDHQSRHTVNSKETAPEALDYLEKIAVDAHVFCRPMNYSHEDQG